eukprot:Pgem_evm1s1718
MEAKQATQKSAKAKARSKRNKNNKKINAELEKQQEEKLKKDREQEAVRTINVFDYTLYICGGCRGHGDVVDGCDDLDGHGGCDGRVAW